MNMLSFFVLSAKKTIAMDRVKKLMLSPVATNWKALIAHDEALGKAFDKLYNIMKTIPGYSNILENHNATSEDLRKIAIMTQMAGYTFARNGDYIPVAVISFGHALNYVLTHKDKIVNYSDAETIEVIDVAITLL